MASVYIIVIFLGVFFLTILELGFFYLIRKMALFRYFICFFVVVNFAGVVFARNKSPLIDEDNIKTRVKAAGKLRG